MPRAQIRLQSNRERCFLDAFVELKKMWMTGANADPDYFHYPFGWKCSDSVDRQEEGMKFDRFEFFAQRKINILRHVGKKAESKMHLIASGPADAANPWIQIGQSFSD
jgi:hypothetical protein